MISLLLAGQLADWASTMWALSTGRFEEGNPLLFGQGWWALTEAKAGGVAAMLWLTSRLTGWRKNGARIALAAVGFWAAGHNIGLVV